MRSKKAMLNSIFALILEMVTIACGFILPRLIMQNFGSAYNGTVAAITQFLSCVALLRAGVCAVTRASLYKPLAEKNIAEVSAIVRATEIFMRKTAGFFVGIVLIVAVGYPFLILDQFSWISTFLLVIILSASTFIQYFFGITYQTLLSADQSQYVISIIQVVTTLLNAIIAVILINSGCSIHIVKLGSALVFAANPLFTYFYVKKKYNIDRSAKPNNDALAQRWDALAFQISFFVNENTDLVLLSFFTNTKEISVYTVYALVGKGVKKIIQTFTSGMEAVFGNMLAQKEDNNLRKKFNAFECFVFAISTIGFVSAALLVVSFVGIYTKGINDANYIRPLFAYVFFAGEFFFCVRIPYQYVVQAAGHYKQTRNGAIFEAVLNIVVSVIFVMWLGLIGVAIGTLCAMIFRTVQYSVYMSRNIIKRSLSVFIKKMLISLVNVVLIVLAVNLLPLPMVDNYFKWAVNALLVAVVATIITLAINFIFYHKELKTIIAVLKNTLKKKNKTA